jgi:hypothetical protein
VWLRIGRAKREKIVTLWSVGMVGGRAWRREVELQEGFVGGGVVEVAAVVAALRRRHDKAARSSFIVLSVAQVSKLERGVSIALGMTMSSRCQQCGRICQREGEVKLDFSSSPRVL